MEGISPLVDNGRVILSERSVARRARSAAPASTAPAPRALCPSCGRPVALLRAGACLYCGAAMTPTGPALEPASKIPPQMLVLLEPRARTPDVGRRWLMRVGAILTGMSAVILLLTGPCRA